MNTKTCPVCNVTKPVTDFYARSKKYPNTPSAYCKPCHRTKVPRPTKEHNRQYQQRRRAARPDVVAAERTAALNWYHSGGWLNRIARRYNITAEQYNSMLASQNGVCAVCHEEDRQGKRLAVDHDHQCCPGDTSCGTCVRGLVCFSCNQAIGLLNDDPSRAMRMADYLRR